MNDFTKGKITKQLLSFSLPMFIGNLVQQMYSMVDMIVVGRYVSGSALASVGISMSVIMFIVSILIGLTTGSSVVISQLFGARQYDRLKSTVSVSIITFLGISITLTVLGTTLSPLIFRLLNTSPEIFNNAVIYMRIMMAGVIFPVFYNLYMAYIRALGDSLRPLYFLICASIINIFLDLFFVLVLNMGVAGVAIATIIAQMISFLLCIIYTYRSIPHLQVRKLVFDSELFKLILKYGTPAALQLSLTSFAMLTITRLINSFGSAAMAGITAANRIDQLATMPVSSLSAALSTFVAQNMGAGLEDRARKGFHTGLISMLIYSVFISTVIMVFHNQFISMFLNPNDVNTPEILRIGGSFLNILAMFYFLFAFLFGFNGFFRGVGDAVAAMALPVFSLAVRTAAAYSLVIFAGMGPEALAWSIFIGWGISSLAGFIYYKKRLWVGKVAVKDLSPVETSL